MATSVETRFDRAGESTAGTNIEETLEDIRGEECGNSKIRFGDGKREKGRTSRSSL